MIEKISINVIVPGINTTHNYMVPAEMIVSSMIDLILQTLSQEYPDVCCNKHDSHVLIQASSGKILASDCGLSRLGIINGERLILT